MIVPVTFYSSRIGTFRPMLAVAVALNPERHIVIKNLADLFGVIAQFHWAKLKATARGEEPDTPIVINYGKPPSRAQASQLIKWIFPETIRVQIGVPRKNYAYDLVAALPFQKPNDWCARDIISISALPTDINPQRLYKDAVAWAPRLKSDGKKLIAIFVGGDTKGEVFTVAQARDFSVQVKKSLADLDQAGQPYDVILSTSRRTTQDVADIIREELAPLCKQIYFYAAQDKGSNPYKGFLLCADAFIVTADSISMMCESVDTAKPVYGYWPLNMKSGGEHTFYQLMLDMGHMRDIGGGIDFNHPGRPIYAQNIIAEHVRDLLAERHSASLHAKSVLAVR